jgi:hypothetical protein
MGKRPLSTDDPCSQDAAQRVKPHIEPIKAQVLKFIAANPGRTCEDATHALALKHQTASARFNDLVAEGKLEFEVRRGEDGRMLRHYRVPDDPRQLKLFGGGQ